MTRKQILCVAVLVSAARMAAYADADAAGMGRTDWPPVVLRLLWLAAFVLAVGAAGRLAKSFARDFAVQAGRLRLGGILFAASLVLWLLFERGNVTGGIRIDLLLLFPFFIVDAVLLVASTGVLAFKVGKRKQDGARAGADHPPVRTDRGSDPGRVSESVAMKLDGSLVREWWSDLLFVGGIVLSVLLFHARGRRFDLGCVIMAVVPLCVFSVALCRTFRRGILRAREAMQEGVGRSPRRTFWSVIRPHMALWGATFALYVVLLEMHFFRRGGIGQAIISAPTVGLALLMVATCFLWAPVCRKSWALTLLSLFTPLVLGALLWGGSMLLVAPLGMEGYMGLGYAIVPPLITSVGLLIGAIITLVRARRKSDAWFQPRAR